MKRALVVQTAYLGDVVLSQPLWASLKKNRPDAEVDLVVQPQWAPLIEPDPHLHQVIRFDKRNEGRGIGGLLRLAAELRRREYDVAFCPHPSFRSALLLWLARIPLRIGFHDSAGSFLYHQRVWRDVKSPETDRVLALLSALGISPPQQWRIPRLTIAENLIQQAEEKLSAWGIEPGKKFACAHPGSVWATKRWLPERFAAVLGDLADDGYQPVVLGGRDDVELANFVQDHCRALPVNLAGKLPLPELALLLSHASLLVTNDSGPMHVAGAVNTPVVAIFGSTVPALGYAPVGSPSRIVEKHLPCRPCGPHGYKRCPLDHFHCMKQITVSEVTSACHELLKNHDRSSDKKEVNLSDE